jgi:hypothetical protein
MYYHTSEANIQAYYYFLPNQEIIFSARDVDLNCLKIERVPTYRYVGNQYEVTLSNLNLEIGDEITIVKSIPQVVQRGAIIGIFYIKYRGGEV